MAISILRKTVHGAIVKLTGTGVQTVLLANLLADMQVPDGNPFAVDIACVYCSTSPTNVIKITRNAIDILFLSGNSVLDIPQTVLREENLSDIVVDLGAVNSTVILHLNKVSGYGVGPL